MKFLFLTLLAILASCHCADARKVRQSLKISKEKTAKAGREVSDSLGRELSAKENSFITLRDGSQALFSPDSIRFAGYEKEANASAESFLIVNGSPACISAIKIKIVYSDMQGRMLHSRIVTHRCLVPPHETRKADIKSWDRQNTYFYYLGNAPRKVATPYKVKILPLAFFSKD